MVNLVVRHSNTSSNPNSQYLRNHHLQPTSPRDKVASGRQPPKPAGRDRIVPSPIRFPSYPKERRPVSPLTTSESMFGGVGREAVEQSRSQSEAGRGGGTVGRMAPLHTSAVSESQGELSCDYDQNVTPLYELLESSHWDQARLRCRTHPEEVQTWIIRKDQNSNTRWKLLPLHAAVIFQAPLPVIECMLKEFPLAAGKRDDQGMLPLHLAFRHKQDEGLLVLLLSQYPQGAMVKDRRERLPVDHGKDTQFSSTFLHQYAEIFARCQINGGRGGNGPSNILVDELKAQHESQVESVKAQHEDQVAALMQKHEDELRDLKLQMEQDQHVVRTQHDQEMDELRDLLSREVAAGQHARQIQGEQVELQTALAQAQAENQRLKSRGGQYENLQAHLEKVMADQKTLHTFCAQQQEELEQARSAREQLLRSLLQKDDEKNAIRSSREISQLSDNIRLRTEQILSKVVASSSAADALATTSALATSLPISPAARSSHLGATEDLHRADDWDARGAHNEGEHGDDISAITDDHF